MMMVKKNKFGFVIFFDKNKHKPINRQFDEFFSRPHAALRWLPMTTMLDLLVLLPADSKFGPTCSYNINH